MKLKIIITTIFSLLFLLLINNKTFSQWNPVSGKLNSLGKYPVISMANNDVVFVGAYDKTKNGSIIYRTTNGGTSFSEVPLTGLQITDRMVTAIKAVTPQIIYFGDGKKDGTRMNPARVFKSINGGSTWSEILNTGEAGYINGIEFSPSNPNFGIIVGDGKSDGDSVKVWKTTDGGVSWVMSKIQLVSKEVVIMYSVFIVDENFYGFGSNAKKIYYTTNGGENWKNSTMNGTGSYIRGIAFDNSKTFGVGVSFSNPSGKLSRTTNGGINWFQVNLPANSISGDASVKWIPNTPTVYVNITNSESTKSYRSEDNGANWVELNFVRSSANLASFDLKYDGINAFLFSTATDGSVFKMQDAPLPVELISFQAITAKDNVNLYWETSFEENNQGFEIYRKHAISEDWNKIGFVKGKGNSNSIEKYDYTDKNLIPGKYEYKLKQIDYNGNFEFFNLSGIVEINNPEKFELKQNYPNPFNPSTKIQFYIPSISNVKLAVYDITGKEVAVLVNENLNPGYYENVFNAGNLTSGIYYYKLTAGNFSETKKMMLVK